MTVDGATRRPAHRLRGGETVDLEVPAASARGADPRADRPDDRPRRRRRAGRRQAGGHGRPSGRWTRPGHPGGGAPVARARDRGCRRSPAPRGGASARQGDVGPPGGRQDPGCLRLAHRAAGGANGVAALSGRGARPNRAGTRASIDAPIGRHPHDRVRMAIRPAGRGKRAVTRYRVLERFARLHLDRGEAGDGPDAPDPRALPVHRPPDLWRRGIPFAVKRAPADPVRGHRPARRRPGLRASQDRNAHWSFRAPYSRPDASACSDIFAKGTAFASLNRRNSHGRMCDERTDGRHPGSGGGQADALAPAQGAPPALRAPPRRVPAPGWRAP